MSFVCSDFEGDVKIFRRTRAFTFPDTGNHGSTSCLRTKSTPHGVKVIDLGSITVEISDVI